MVKTRGDYMTMQFEMKDNGKILNDKIEVLRKTTAALLNEVKSLGSLRKVEEKRY